MAKIPHIGLKELIAQSDCVLLARVISVGDEKGQKYAIIQPIQQFKGKVGSSAKFLIGAEINEAVVFALTPNMITLLCLQTDKDKMLYSDTWWGRGTMPVVSLQGRQMVAVYTQDVIFEAKFAASDMVSTNATYKKFYSYTSFLSVVKMFAAMKHISGVHPGKGK